MLVYRPAVTDDLDAMLALLHRSAQRHVLPGLTPQGQAYYLAQLDRPVLADKLADRQRFGFALAWCGGQLVGLAAVRWPAHVYYLFVDEAFQRQGVARQLWQRLQASAPDARLWRVNAAPGAVVAYQHLGFVATGPEQQLQGIRYVPMQCQCAGPDLADGLA